MDSIERIGPKWEKWTEVERIVLNGNKIGLRWTEIDRIDLIGSKLVEWTEVE